jgi:isoleucyl-tRNA synthetase
MAHPDITYYEVKVKDEVLILAKSRVPEVMNEAGINDYVVLREFKGKELEGIEYEHPLEDLVPAQQLLKAYHRVVLTEDGVTESEGTGLVHSAPGHGEIDYDVGKKVGSPVISLVNEKGYMTKDAGFVAGLYFRSDANKQVVAVLQERNALLHKGKIRHRYPVCWRCKTPLVLRAAPQWVLKVTKLKSTLMTEADKVRWIPEWAKTRFKNMLQELRDWIISRQRFWGIPLPIWICEKCGSTRVIGSLEELERESGIKIENAHRPWVDNVKLKCSCGGVATQRTGSYMRS